MTDTFLTDMMQSADFPLLTAFLLGLLVSLNPCQLAISISALTFMLRNETEKGRIRSLGVRYAVGRSVAYLSLGAALRLVLMQGRHVDLFERLLAKGETLLPYILISVGLFFVFRAHHHHHHSASCHNSNHIIHQNGRWGAFALGFILAFLFCPESVVFFFGMMLPLSISSPVGLWVVFMFAVAASLPVLILFFFASSAAQRLHRFEHRMERLQRWVNILSAFVFFGLAAWLLWAEL